MDKLQCTNCNFQFVPKKDKLPTRCPYCNKEGTLEKHRDMQALIDEVTSEMRDED